MAETLLINTTPMETRVALLDNGNLIETFIERQSKLSLVGNIYRGEVVRVLPGMQAAFIEAGLSRTAFLHASDMLDNELEPVGKKPATSFKELIAKTTPLETNVKPDIPIEQRVRAGDKVTVQVVKDMLGTKGARLTTDLSLPSRFLVYLPNGNHIGVSQRIEDSDKRSQLKLLLRQALDDAELAGGLIARTAAENASTEQLIQDVKYLAQLWSVIKQQASSAKTALIFSDLPLPERTLRDMAHSETENVFIDDIEVFDQCVKFAEVFAPSVVPKLNFYEGKQPLFDAYRVEEDLQKALKRRVDLKSGGYLVIDQTEAMTTIDVNTGSFVGGRSLEETVFKTNLEATSAIARQLRLRNLGGIIILDFIDMIEAEHRVSVMEALECELERDPSKTNITQVSKLGLIEMTRKRTKESLQNLLCEPCQTCDGRGFIKTRETVCYEIFREMLRLARAYEQAKRYTIVAHAEVIDLLLSSEAGAVGDLESLIDAVISFQVEASYTQEQYDIILT